MILMQHLIFDLLVPKNWILNVTFNFQDLIIDSNVECNFQFIVLQDLIINDNIQLLV